MEHDLTLKDRNSKLSMLNRAPTSNKCFIARESGESLKVGTQMTGVIPGASTGDAIKLHTIIWKDVRRHVRRLQRRIAKAVSDNEVKQPGCLTVAAYRKRLSRMTGNCHVLVLRRESGSNARDLSGEIINL